MNRRRPALVFAVFLLSGCSSMPVMPEFSLPTLPSLRSPSGSDDRTRATIPNSSALNAGLGRAIELLGAGRAEEARGELRAVLNKSPKNETALSLLAQIDADPASLLGQPGDTYVVAAGDTMSELADRFLGDPLLFYALGRYNGMTAPNSLSEGRSLKLPARAKAAVAPRAQALGNASMHSPGSAMPAVVDEVKASATRMKALESLNQGDVDLAIVLLKQAQALNASDAAIDRDLERAMRIKTALKDG
jgi:hypothetical protein